MKLTGYEMETIILYNQAEPNAQVYTHDAKLIAKLSQTARHGISSPRTA